MVQNKCCFCFDLRRGSLISGYLIMLYNTVLLGIRCHTLGSLYMMGQDPDGGFDLDWLWTWLGLAMLVITGFIIIIFLQIISTAVLLLGLHKSKPRPILASLITTGILLAIDVTLTTSIVISYCEHYDEYIWSTVALDYVFKCLYVFLLCVCGRYRSNLHRLHNQGQTIGNMQYNVPKAI